MVYLTLGSNRGGGGGGWADICDINIAIIHESLPKFTYTVVASNVVYSA